MLFPHLLLLLAFPSSLVHAGDAECTDVAAWFDGSITTEGYNCSEAHAATLLLTTDRLARLQSVRFCISTHGHPAATLNDAVNYTFSEFFFPHFQLVDNVPEVACADEVIELKRGIWDYCQGVASEVEDLLTCMPTGHGCVQGDFSSICNAESAVNLALRMCKLYKYTVQHQGTRTAVMSEMNAILNTEACTFPWWDSTATVTANLTAKMLTADCSIAGKDNGMYQRAILNLACYETLELSQTGQILSIRPKCAGEEVLYAMDGVIDSSSNLSVAFQFIDVRLSTILGGFFGSDGDIFSLWFTLQINAKTDRLVVRHGDCYLEYEITSNTSNASITTSLPFFAQLPAGTFPPTGAGVAASATFGAAFGLFGAAAVVFFEK